VIHRQEVNHIQVLDGPSDSVTLMLIGAGIDTHAVLSLSQVRNLYFALGASLDGEGDYAA
jgi:hypothetical protein